MTTYADFSAEQRAVEEPSTSVAELSTASLSDVLSDPDRYSDRECLLALCASQYRVEETVASLVTQARPVIETISQKGLSGLLMGGLR